MIKFNFRNETDKNIANYRSSIKKAIEATIVSEKIKEDLEISLLFVEDNSIKKINKKYRGIDKPTDVLSFPMIDYGTKRVFSKLTREDKKLILQENDNEFILLGDIVVSLETIKRQAKDFDNTFKNELLLMVIHSTLHLLGYDHMVEEEKEVMFNKQLKILKGLKNR